jgi:hypothetical protein
MQSARIWHCSWTTCCHSPRQPVSDLRPARLNHSRHRRLSPVIYISLVLPTARSEP